MGVFRSKKMNFQYWFIKRGLRYRQRDNEKIRSMINSAEVNVIVTKEIKLNKNSATLIFREIYESIRQLGDAKLWLQGYEPLNHEVSMEILKEFYTYPIDKTIKDRTKGIIMFTADDEEEDGRKSLKIYNKDLGGKIIELKGHGHYTTRNMGTEDLPQLIEEVIK